MNKNKKESLLMESINDFYIGVGTWAIKKSEKVAQRINTCQIVNQSNKNGDFAKDAPENFFLLEILFSCSLLD